MMLCMTIGVMMIVKGLGALLEGSQYFRCVLPIAPKPRD